MSFDQDEETVAGFILQDKILAGVNTDFRSMVTNDLQGFRTQPFEYLAGLQSVPTLLVQGLLQHGSGNQSLTHKHLAKQRLFSLAQQAALTLQDLLDLFRGRLKVFPQALQRRHFTFVFRHISCYSKWVHYSQWAEVQHRFEQRLD